MQIELLACRAREVNWINWWHFDDILEMQTINLLNKNLFRFDRSAQKGSDFVKNNTSNKSLPISWKLSQLFNCELL